MTALGCAATRTCCSRCFHLLPGALSASCSAGDEGLVQLLESVQRLALALSVERKTSFALNADAYAQPVCGES